MFDTWIAPLSLNGVKDGHLRLSAPSRLIRDYVTSHHATRLERALTAVASDFVSLEIVIAAPEARNGNGTAKSAPQQRQTPPLPPLNAPPGVKAAGVSLQGLWERSGHVHSE